MTRRRKRKGGLQPGLTEELLASQEELKDAVFGNPTGVIVGPVDVQGKFFVLEVEKLNPAKVRRWPKSAARSEPS